MAADNNDLSMWYRADHDTARAVYAAADSSTLAAMLPALELEIETGRQALALWQRRFAEGQDVDSAGGAPQRRRTGTARPRAGGTGVAAVGRRVGVTLQSALQDVRARSQATGQSLVDIAFIQSVALTQRRHLVREELQRRGLLPIFPR